MNFGAFEMTVISILLLYSGINIGIALGLRRAQKMRRWDTIKTYTLAKLGQITQKSFSRHRCRYGSKLHF